MCKKSEATASNQAPPDPIMTCANPGRGRLIVLVETLGESGGVEGVTVHAGEHTQTTSALGQAMFSLPAGRYALWLTCEGPLDDRYDVPLEPDEVTIREGRDESHIFLIWPATWIELHDRTAGEPVPVRGARWVVTWGASNRIEGVLGNDGRARVRGLGASKLAVAFPEYDRELWEPAAE